MTMLGIRWHDIITNEENLARTDISLTVIICTPAPSNYRIQSVINDVY